MTDTFNPLIGLNVWARSLRLALNKPLLVLLALGFLSQDKKDIAFASVEVKLNNLLREFGSNVKSPRAEYPFWRLQNDGIWTVTPGDLDVNSSGDVYATTLRKVNATGRFNQNVLDWLFADKKRLTTATHEVLNVYFPDSLHDELLSAVGFIAFDEPALKVRRDPNFRAAVLSAYRLRCAVCSQDVRIGSMTVALEAAHIKMHQAGGPDVVSNGLCLCSTHHKLFDLGAFTINEDLHLLVSEHITGSDRLDELLLRFHGSEIARPVHPEQFPDHSYLRWHRKIVFKEGSLPYAALGLS